MDIAYGAINLGMAKTVIERSAVYTDDLSQYLWTKCHLNVSGVLNAQTDALGNFLATSYAASDPRISPPGDPHPSAVLGSAAPSITDRAIRHYMLTPRRQLLVTDDGLTVLRSPQPGFDVDCAGVGPTPLAFGIQEAVGQNRTYFVNWQCECTINECDSATGNDPPALLAHRFVMERDVDPDYFEVWTTTGSAHFRVDRLRQLARNPAALTSTLFAPVKFGFQRRDVRVKTFPNGDGFTYSYTDFMTTNFFVAGQSTKVASVSAVHRQALVSDPQVYEGAMQAYERFLNWSFLKTATREDGAKGKRPLRKPYSPPPGP